MDNIQYDFGMIGLGTMGCNLLLNMADHGFAVIGYDKNIKQTKKLESTATKGTIVKGVSTLKEMISKLKKPRKLMMLVPAGPIVDSVLNELTPLLQKDDIIIDGGNSHYTDTLRRIDSMSKEGFHFMGVGISGGEDGARNGPSIMPGGDKKAYAQVETILKAIAAKVNNEPCVGYLGNNAAGHYVKMVHNGIEYSIMQIISECYDLMNHGLKLSNKEISNVFNEWNNEELKSFLLEITAIIFKKDDDKTKGILVDYILDKAGAKGTGQWTSESGLDLPTPVPSIDSAVMMRTISSLVDERIEVSKLYKIKPKKFDIDKSEFISELKDAMFFGMMISYAQGLAMIATASKELKMNIPLKEVVSVWRGGCIIRSEMLPLFMEVFNDGKLENVLLDASISKLIKTKLPGVRNVLSTAILNNYPSAGLMSSLNYLNAFCREKLPTNLIQAQRDFFGAHTYERTDEPGIFHTIWETVL